MGIVYQSALESGTPRWWKRPMPKSFSRRLATPPSHALLAPLKLRILVEPGRFIVGNAGILVTRVEYVKSTGRKNFVIVDAAMNDLIRPPSTIPITRLCLLPAGAPAKR